MVHTTPIHPNALVRVPSGTMGDYSSKSGKLKDEGGNETKTEGSESNMNINMNDVVDQLQQLNANLETQNQYLSEISVRTLIILLKKQQQALLTEQSKALSTMTDELISELGGIKLALILSYLPIWMMVFVK